MLTSVNFNRMIDYRGASHFTINFRLYCAALLINVAYYFVLEGRVDAVNNYVKMISPKNSLKVPFCLRTHKIHTICYPGRG